MHDRRRPATARTAAAPCGDCADGLLHCHDVLVLHVDGTASCEGFPGCLLDPGCHDHVVACVELGACACESDDRSDGAALPLAA